MKFITAPVASVGEATGVRSYRPHWFNEWLANRSRYVLLQCGHKETLANADTTICLIQTFKTVDVFCIQCDGFSAIKQSLSISEYHEIPPVNSVTPLF